jgi:acetyl/propionyl-CoA carboxylase alpha subunit
MFSKILIANRGEIACRIARACRALGVPSAAVYSEADRGALHVRTADEALFIGPASPAESYLNIEKLIEAAQKCGAEAVHPGYGFLSERAAFAEACEGAGLVFIGPSPETLRTAGDKIASREAALAAGVSIIPGAVPADDADWADAAARLGYPVMVKAAAGGGGRGMRRVAAPGELDEALAGARAEARAVFGDDRLYLEKTVPAARHIEVQILGDGTGGTNKTGGAIHLGERECSLQRRHQKIFEETPAPGLAPMLRDEIHTAALRIASSVRYRGAGTVEFLIDGGGDFYFLEINARLQVEHPVTEMATGLDLVALQIRIAAEGRLPLTQDEVRFSGHAAEARLYAEDPARDFMPQTGTLRALRLPEGEGVRVDSGVEAGSAVGADYDALLAKIIARGEDRADALDRLGGALSALGVAGLRTNQWFLKAVCDHPVFRAGELGTDFIERRAGELGGEILEAEMEDARIAAALGAFLAANGGAGSGGLVVRGAEGAESAERVPDPWARPGGWLPGGLT